MSASPDSPPGDRLVTTVAIVCAVIGVGGGLAAARWRREVSPTAPRRPLIDFTLTERSGRTVTRADLTNQLLVVNCIFTSCSLSCRVVNDRMAEIQRRVASRRDVRLLSLTIDPRTDTPAALATFANSHHADPERWWFLTGDKSILYPLIEACFVDQPGALDGVPGGFANTDRIYLVDRNGVVRKAFNGLKATVPDAVIRALDQLTPIAAP